LRLSSSGYGDDGDYPDSNLAAPQGAAISLVVGATVSAESAGSVYVFQNVSLDWHSQCQLRLFKKSSFFPAGAPCGTSKPAHCQAIEHGRNAGAVSVKTEPLQQER
jgi:hypothetical protein